MDIKDNERKFLIEDHDYDGIKELDNKPPPWLMWVFYLTVLWSAGYFGYFVFFGGPNQATEYSKEIAIVDSTKTDSLTKGLDENNIVLLKDEKSFVAGAELYKSKTCFTCHGNNGEGNNVGPNLTDNAWIHGNKPNEVFKTIKYGFITKGMLPYKDQLSDQQILELTSYILIKFKGSNPANAKAPQGTVIN
jgi:cytochrome c oxidase cbb3-type subunit 3